jgi:ketosteroid isomerase-like protein
MRRSTGCLRVFDEEDAIGWEGMCRSGSNGKSAANLKEWFRDAAARDVDALMTKIDDHVVSYEHVIPLQYSGANAVREVCRRGFEAMKGQFRWDIPDLQVIVRDDIAVTWGLNRMQAQESGKPGVELWSRGTRIFQKVDGKWKLIHQHVSFPYDPGTGAAKTDLKP